VSRVACIFGGRSVEHEVSVITAQQAMAALDGKHRAIPVYIAKDGRWHTGAALTELQRFADIDSLLADCTPVTPVIDASRAGLMLTPTGPPRRGLFGRGAAEPMEVDVVMPLLHGALGEDGTLQGLLEMVGIPYTGSGVAASALAMDKRLTKTVLRAAGLPVLADTCIDREAWRRDPAEALQRAEAGARYPLYVKPVTLGSSIGVSRASNADELSAAIEVALTYDLRCLVEPAQEDIVEINCAVLGDDTGARASLLEQPTKRGLLSYDDKYRSKGGKSTGSTGMKSAQRLIPAPLDETLAAQVTAAALAAFAAVGAAGVARVDLMVDPVLATLVINEINPIPGSLAFYLFEPAGVSFPDLLDELIELALRRHARNAATTAVFEGWMLGGGGVKSAP
jgi:D-alanine-D-alanine ligase